MQINTSFQLLGVMSQTELYGKTLQSSAATAGRSRSSSSSSFCSGFVFQLLFPGMLKAPQIARVSAVWGRIRSTAKSELHVHCTARCSFYGKLGCRERQPSANCSTRACVFLIREVSALPRLIMPQSPRPSILLKGQGGEATCMF